VSAPADADEAEVARFRHALEAVLGAIGDACARVGRQPDDVELVAVSKTVSIERVRAAIVAGQRTFGENRVQEGAAKAGALRPAPSVWRLIGPLQGNKAGAAVDAFESIDAIDSLSIARRVDRLIAERQRREPLPILVQVNVDGDPAKHGWSPDALVDDLPELLTLPHVRVDGLMTIGRPVGIAEEARSTFRSLRTLSERLRRDHRELGPVLSMGMTDDFEVAVEEGSTRVRVGRALFGDRPGR
jgi:PLP dependent protein